MRMITKLEFDCRHIKILEMDPKNKENNCVFWKNLVLQQNILNVKFILTYLPNLINRITG
jgi:hypothetical protein